MVRIAPRSVPISLRRDDTCDSRVFASTTRCGQTVAISSSLLTILPRAFASVSRISNDRSPTAITLPQYLIWRCATETSHRPKENRSNMTAQRFMSRYFSLLFKLGPEGPTAATILQSSTVPQSTLRGGGRRPLHFLASGDDAFEPRTAHAPLNSRAKPIRRRRCSAKATARPLISTIFDNSHTQTCHLRRRFY